ncbi:MAG: VOC family protein [Burkholderiales bacterium]|uniref:VOC family protein n=1 Tax=Inhella sp. TaxID=1921806 RepID=UPI001AD02732|nr:VOC family protein [Burkholderiales bacterium]
MKAFDDIYATPGAFSWNELATPDPAKACAFYGSLFGWRFENMNYGPGDYFLIKVGDTSVGGVMAPQGPMPACWNSYVTVADCDATVEKAKGLGGTVCAGPFDIPHVGRMAVLQDPQGAVIQVISYTPKS